MKASKISGKVVAISIGESNINLCEVAFKGDVLKVYKSVELKTPEFSYEDGIIKDYAALVKALNEAFREYDIRTRRVVFSVASSKILSKEVVIPAGFWNVGITYIIFAFGFALRAFSSASIFIPSFSRSIPTSFVL